MRVLKARLYEIEMQKHTSDIAENRSQWAPETEVNGLEPITFLKSN